MANKENTTIQYIDLAFTKRLVAVMEENYHDFDFTVFFICENMNISRTHLHRKIKSNFNKSSTAFINDFRIEKAKSKLHSNQIISEVANQVGYKDVKYFSKLFKQKFGVSPKGYSFSILKKVQI